MLRIRRLSGLFCLFCCVGIHHLSGQHLAGRVESEGEGVPDVHVMNSTRGKATITGELGNFTLPVQLNDTLLFSAVQFRRKVLVVTASLLESRFVLVPLEEFVNELDEVVLRPYNLSGDLALDMESIQTGYVVSATSLGLPNAYVKPMIQSERLLKEATTGPGIPINPLLNAISGRTKMLKKRVARDHKSLQIEKIRGYFADSLYEQQLKIPQERIADFMYFCEVDSSFDSLVRSDDTIALWELLSLKSTVYRSNNNLD